mgnify:CR=1 FL=1
MNCLDSLLEPANGSIASGSARVIAVIGSGGKSTLLRALGMREVGRGGSALLVTTTHFLPFEGIELVTSGDMDDVRDALDRGGIACVGTPTGDALGRLAAPTISLEELARAAGLVVVEADGSRRLPLKAHAPHEPVVPPEATSTVAVVGASGFGRRVADVMHRCELACERLGCSPDDAATPELVARLMADEIARGLIAPDALVVNQAETDVRRRAGRAFATALREEGCELPVLIGGIRSGEPERVDCR